MNRKKKVLAYFYRNIDGIKEVLVFDHQDMPEAGTQIVGGTVEANEDLKLALTREIFEEAGLSVEISELVFLAETVYKRKDRPEINQRSYFKISGEKLPNHWSHRVISDGEDNGLIFLFYWIPVDQAFEKLTGNFAECLHLI
jgi:ADP-ribose pyrophosphatase YjhB (NUDIX family)